MAVPCSPCVAHKEGPCMGRLRLAIFHENWAATTCPRAMKLRFMGWWPCDHLRGGGHARPSRILDSMGCGTTHGQLAFGKENPCPWLGRILQMLARLHLMGCAHAGSPWLSCASHGQPNNLSWLFVCPTQDGPCPRPPNGGGPSCAST